MCVLAVPALSLQSQSVSQQSLLLVGEECCAALYRDLTCIRAWLCFKQQKQGASEELTVTVSNRKECNSAAPAGKVAKLS